MSDIQIKARRTWLLNNKKRAKSNQRRATGFWLHQRGYHHGDIRCTICDKWIDPVGDRFPGEAMEIEVTAGGKRRHHYRYCSDRLGSRNGASFSTVPQQNERWRQEEVYRY